MSAVWTPAEKRRLSSLWGSVSSVYELERHFPGRTIAAIKSKSIGMKLPPKGPRKPNVIPWTRIAIRDVLTKNRAATAHQIADHAGISYPGVIKTLRSSPDHFHISGWTRNAVAGKFTARWSLGAGESAPKPARKDHRKALRDCRAKKKMKSAEFNPFASAMSQLGG